jgi:hypothetical protein
MMSAKNERKRAAGAGGTSGISASFEPDIVAAARASPTFRPYVDTYLNGGGDPKLLERFRPGKNPSWAEKQQFLTGYLAGGGSMGNLLALRGKQAQIESEIEQHIDQQRHDWDKKAEQPNLSRTRANKADRSSSVSRRATEARHGPRG